MTKKHAPTSVRLPPDLKDALQKQANSEFRPLANLLEKILTEWALEQGLLPERRTRTRANHPHRRKDDTPK